MTDISLIVCTRDRGRQLARTLASIEKQTFTGSWELIVVDNGSSDCTASVLSDFVDATKIRVKTVFEARAGLSRARNRGLAFAEGKIVAFTDDDCYPEPDYLEAIANCFLDPNIAFCGGRVLLFDAEDRRLTLQESNEKLALSPGSYLRSGLIHGANMAFRKDVVLAARGFDERLGAGTRFKSGEDTDLLRRLSAEGRHGIYEPSIVVYHHHGRKTDEDEDELRRSYQVGYGACMAKFCINPRTRSLYLRRWYWSLRGSSFSKCFAELRAGLEFLARSRMSKKRVLEHPHESLKI